MLSLLAAVVLTGSEPSAAALAGQFVQVQQALPGEQPTFDGWTRSQLEQELVRLEEARPGIGLPVTLVAVGAAIGVIDLVVFVFGGLIALLGGGGFQVPFSVGLAVFAVGAVGMLIVGIIFLRAALGERRENSRQMEAVREALLQLAPPFPTPPPMQQDVLPPPPPPFPQVQFTPPWFAVTLARF